MEISFFEEASTARFQNFNDSSSYYMGSSNMGNHNSHRNHNNYDLVYDSCSGGVYDDIGSLAHNNQHDQNVNYKTFGISFG